MLRNHQKKKRGKSKPGGKRSAAERQGAAERRACSEPHGPHLAIVEIKSNIRYLLCPAGSGRSCAYGYARPVAEHLFVARSPSYAIQAARVPNIVQTDLYPAHLGSQGCLARENLQAHRCLVAAPAVGVLYLAPIPRHKSWPVGAAPIVPQATNSMAPPRTTENASSTRAFPMAQVAIPLPSSVGPV